MFVRILLLSKCQTTGSTIIFWIFPRHRPPQQLTLNLELQEMSRSTPTLSTRESTKKPEDQNFPWHPKYFIYQLWQSITVVLIGAIIHAVMMVHIRPKTSTDLFGIISCVLNCTKIGAWHACCGNSCSPHSDSKPVQIQMVLAPENL